MKVYQPCMLFLFVGVAISLLSTSIASIQIMQALENTKFDVVADQFPCTYNCPQDGILVCLEDCKGISFKNQENSCIDCCNKIC